MGQLSAIKRLIILFWACYFTVVMLSNLCDALVQFNLLPKDWLFNSNNYQAILHVIGHYHLSSGIAKAFLFGDILWLLVAACLFWFAAFNMTSSPAIYRAMFVSIALWMGFVLIEEIFIAYQFEPTHIRLLLTELASLLVLQL